MPVLLLRLAGPLQSWGIASRFSHRDTAREPSKSGIVGLLCAALGVPREDDATVAQLAALPMGVRVNREGLLTTEFQTVGGGSVPGRDYGVARANGSSGGTVLSYREVLQDADFLVGLQTDDTGLLDRLDQALHNPYWPLYLGRRAHVPGLPVAAGIVAAELPGALAAPGSSPAARFVLEADEGEPRFDVPVSFHPQRRAFRLRYVTMAWGDDHARPRAAGTLAPVP